MKTYNDANAFDFLNDLDVSRECYITMTCIYCAPEVNIPALVYGDVSDFLKEIGESDPPCFQYSKCHRDTLYRKN